VQCVDILLDSRRRFHVRPIRPDDKERLAWGLGQLSAETIQRRFLSPKPRFSSAELRYLTEVDGRDHVALVALPANHPDWIVAVARFVRLPEDPTAAEFAVVVADAYQGRGLGKRLAMLLTERAKELGIRRFTATTQADNRPAQRLIEAIGSELEYVHQGNVTEVVAQLAA
jgi:RimJ/RimL family protein N-acetyltransferase